MMTKTERNKRMEQLPDRNWFYFFIKKKIGRKKSMELNKFFLWCNKRGWLRDVAWMYALFQKKYQAAMESPGIGIVTPDWLVNSLENKSLLPTADFHPDLLESVKDSPPRQSALDPSDDTVLEDLHTLLPSDFDDLLNSTPTTTSSLSSSSTNFSSTANALDITASISAVIAHSVQMEQQKKAAELERSNSRPSSGTDSNSQGMFGRLIDCSVDWSIDTLFRKIGRLIDWFPLSNDWLSVPSIHRSIDWLSRWISRLIVWLVDHLFDWLINCLA